MRFNILHRLGRIRALVKSKIKYFTSTKQTKRNIRNIISNGDDIFLELGAGNKKGKGGWLTLDMVDKCDLYWDLRYGIPFPDLSVAMIYSSHFFEHLTFTEGQTLLEECKRVLLPGGVFSICVPNARIYIEAYLQDNCKNIDNYFKYKPAYNNTTKIDYINYVAYMGGVHKYMFDEENLLHILRLTGFVNVHVRTFNPDIDLIVRDFESIYVEAQKSK